MLNNLCINHAYVYESIVNKYPPCESDPSITIDTSNLKRIVLTNKIYLSLITNWLNATDVCQLRNTCSVFYKSSHEIAVKLAYNANSTRYLLQ